MQEKLKYEVERTMGHQLKNWLCQALGSEYFLEARLPNCITGAVNMSS